jgi:hypothetical protein
VAGQAVPAWSRDMTVACNHVSRCTVLPLTHWMSSTDKWWKNTRVLSTDWVGEEIMVEEQVALSILLPFLCNISFHLSCTETHCTGYCTQTGIYRECSGYPFTSQPWWWGQRQFPKRRFLPATNWHGCVPEKISSLRKLQIIEAHSVVQTLTHSCSGMCSSGRWLSETASPSLSLWTVVMQLI